MDNQIKDDILKYYAEILSKQDIDSSEKEQLLILMNNYTEVLGVDNENVEYSGTAVFPNKTIVNIKFKININVIIATIVETYNILSIQNHIIGVFMFLGGLCNLVEVNEFDYDDPTYLNIIYKLNEKDSLSFEELCDELKDISSPDNIQMALYSLKSAKMLSYSRKKYSLSDEVVFDVKKLKILN